MSASTVSAVRLGIEFDSSRMQQELAEIDAADFGPQVIINKGIYFKGTSPIGGSYRYGVREDKMTELIQVVLG